jgi:site-specific DNA-methyltransferase (adenine-specific)
MLEIVNIPIRKIKPYENNTKIHTHQQIEHIMNSIKEFGFNDPIAVWGEKNIIIEGHGRYEALKKLGYTDVPCVRLDSLTDQQRKAYTIAHNHINAETGLDLRLLEVELSAITEVELAPLGFEGFENVIPTDPDQDPEPELENILDSEECIVSYGDVWQLGRHRLMCCDSTNTDEIEILMNGELADLVLTDPPYGMNLTGMVRNQRPDGTWIRQKVSFANETLDDEAFYNFLIDSYNVMKTFLLPGRNLYVFCSYHKIDFFVIGLKESKLVYEQILIWVKEAFSLGGTKYQHQQEFILLARNGKETDKQIWNGQRDQTDVLNFTRHKDSSIKHATSKPVPLLIYLMRNSSNIGDLIFDQFGGSGSTLIAAEQCGRTCYMAELDPIYCTQIIRRWEKLTGEKATKIKIDNYEQIQSNQNNCE